MLKSGEKLTNTEPSVKNGRAENVIFDLTRNQALMGQTDCEKYYDYDCDYHKAFFLHCQNRFLLDAYESVNIIRAFR